jgi:glyoxylase-like metal-dependent hydrolase (beta-lactamase superfamily II)
MSGVNSIIRGTNKFTRIIVNHLVDKIDALFRYEPCQCDIIADDNYDLNNLGFNAYILHTPGHSTGSISVIIDDELAIVGDAMFGVFKGSVFPPFADNTDLMIKSWGRLLDTSCKIFLPAHGSANSRELLQKEYDKRKK